MDIDSQALGRVRDDVGVHHPEVNVMTCVVDVSSEKMLHEAMEETVRQFGSIDIAVNAAGINDPAQATHEVSLDAWQKVIDINQTGCWLSERAEIQQMLQQAYVNYFPIFPCSDFLLDANFGRSRGPRCGRGVIINVASALGLCAPVTGAPFPSYTAAKHGIFPVFFLLFCCSMTYNRH